jgi:DNA recombination protein RmuC
VEVAADGLILVALVIVAALLAVVLLELRRGRAAAPQATAALGTRVDALSGQLGAKVDALSGQLGARLGESTDTSRALATLVQDQLSDANRSLHGLAERIGRLDEATRQVEQVGRSIAGLEQILASPKLRGGLGEWSLEALLREVLPADQIERQYRLASQDTIVDVAVKLADGRLIAIDSKFPLEAYRRLLDAEGDEAERRRRELHRAVRGRVDEIARRYIAPEDGTLDFAFMYIPSEALYYQLAVDDAGDDFLAYSRAQRVIPCSPNTLYAYLQAVLLGLRGLHIAEHARELHAALDRLGQEVGQTRELFDRAAAQLHNASQNIDAAAGALSRVEARLEAMDRVGEVPPRATRVPPDSAGH